MEVISLQELFVFRITPNKKGTFDEKRIAGGALDVDDSTLAIFSSSFNGKLGRGSKLQPFHFRLDGTERKNTMRDDLLKTLADSSLSEKVVLLRSVAFRLTKMIDNRTGELLLTVAIGKNDTHFRIALWAYPHDDPIQLATETGLPKVQEIQNAFSKSSYLRKAAYFEEELSTNRNSLLKGNVVDSAAGRVNIDTNYWLHSFLEGIVDLLPVRGTNLVIKAIKAAQSKAKSSEEKSSVAAAMHSLLSGSKKDTTINEIGGLLVGEAKTEYGKQFTGSNDRDARFAIDSKELRSRVKNIIIRLKNGIDVYFPTNETVDPNDYLFEQDGKRILRIDHEVEGELF